MLAQKSLEQRPRPWPQSRSLACESHRLRPVLMELQVFEKVILVEPGMRHDERTTKKMMTTTKIRFENRHREWRARFEDVLRVVYFVRSGETTGERN